MCSRRLLQLVWVIWWQDTSDLVLALWSDLPRGILIASLLSRRLMHVLLDPDYRCRMWRLDRRVRDYYCRVFPFMLLISFCPLSLCIRLDCFCCAVLPPEVHCTPGPKGKSTVSLLTQCACSFKVYKCIHLQESTRNRVIAAFPCAFVPWKLLPCFHLYVCLTLTWINQNISAGMCTLQYRRNLRTGPVSHTLC